MSDRKAELERKRKKLEEIRRAREEKKRQEQDSAKTAAKAAAASSAKVESDIDRKKREADELLKGILPDDVIDGTGVSVPHPLPIKTASVQDQAQVQSAPAAVIPKKAPKLVMSQTAQTNIPPKLPVLYSKETQTPVVDKDEKEEEEVKPKPIQQESQPETEEKTEQHKEEEVVIELSEEQKDQILGSQEFSRFFDKAVRLVERALTEDLDITIDYSGAEGDDLEGGSQAARELTLSRDFYDERWSRHRTVTCLDWSNQYPELLVASYNNNEDAPHEPDGVALIWNLKFAKTTPEYIFHCQSAVMSATFAKFHPNLIIGGTYSGQIVLWDNRSSKRTPVQRTPLSATAHTHPVYCVNVVGTQNAHNLISVSTDGKMCSWSLDMLSQPQDSMELQYKQSKSVAVTCMSFLAGDVNNFVVGSEEGTVYTACRHGSKAGISDVFEGHYGPVTGIDTHSASGPIDFSHLFLTSSFDWTLKLWSHKSPRPYYSFEDNGDYIYDVKWSPIHPALFATVDGTGRLDLWNLNSDTEVPIASTATESLTALNNVQWTQSGQQISVGDDDGRVYIYDVGEQLATPRNDEWSRLQRTLQDIQANAAGSVSETVGSPRMSPSKIPFT
ncbi:cytoplasmic dynein 1 intermediate chain 2 [Nematostella vectensis]|uniref:cytoplasmic dynein 1 intermediate chain 2 n=1 Tax=Nematostella vectensis TaxID=45351 RepID=UPI0020777C66|nr:cytoplasmic dynein 1 intermediate chain 2 [Nematostella vectensis]